MVVGNCEFARVSGSKCCSSSRITAIPSFRPAACMSQTDPDDNMFLECADAARADYLVTGNQKHFPRFWKNTKIITTREFISLTAPHLIK